MTRRTAATSAAPPDESPLAELMAASDAWQAAVATMTPEQRADFACFYEYHDAEHDRLSAEQRAQGFNPAEGFDFSAKWREAGHVAAAKVAARRRRRERRAGTTLTAAPAQRPRGAGRPRARTATRSSAKSGDSGSDEPPAPRRCAAPWCQHPVVGSPTKRYCGTARCKAALAAERQRKHRHGDLTAVELERLADARLAGYVGGHAFAAGLSKVPEPEPHSLSFLWRNRPGDDPGERAALEVRACRCDGHHIDGGVVGCFKCGLARETVA